MIRVRDVFLLESLCTLTQHFVDIVSPRGDGCFRCLSPAPKSHYRKFMNVVNCRIVQYMLAHNIKGSLRLLVIIVDNHVLCKEISRDNLYNEALVNYLNP